MGMIIKVYIENCDQEVNITTLNSDDKKSTTVTITAAYIQDCLNEINNRSKTCNDILPCLEQKAVCNNNAKPDRVQNKNIRGKQDPMVIDLCSESIENEYDCSVCVSRIIHPLDEYISREEEEISEVEFVSDAEDATLEDCTPDLSLNGIISSTLPEITRGDIGENASLEDSALTESVPESITKVPSVNEDNDSCCVEIGNLNDTTIGETTINTLLGCEPRKKNPSELNNTEMKSSLYTIIAENTAGSTEKTPPINIDTLNETTEVTVVDWQQDSQILEECSTSLMESDVSNDAVREINIQSRISSAENKVKNNEEMPSINENTVSDNVGENNSNEITEDAVVDSQKESQNVKEYFNQIELDVGNMVEDFSTQSKRSRSVSIEKDKDLRETISEDQIEKSNIASCVFRDSGMGFFIRTFKVTGKLNSDVEEGQITVLETENNELCSRNLTDRDADADCIARNLAITEKPVNAIESPTRTNDLSSSCKPSSSETQEELDAELSRVESSENIINKLNPVKNPENVIASLKNISYDVDDFLNPSNECKKRKHEDTNVPSEDLFGNDLNGIFRMEKNSESDLEEYFVIDRVVGSRFNTKTKRREFLLNPKKCNVKGSAWTPLTNLNIDSASPLEPDCLFIQWPKMLRLCRKRKLKELNESQEGFPLKHVFTKSSSIENPIRFDNKPINKIGEKDDLLPSKNANEKKKMLTQNGARDNEQPTMNDDIGYVIDSLGVDILPNECDHFAEVMVDDRPTDFVSKVAASQLVPKKDIVKSERKLQSFAVTKTGKKSAREKFRCQKCPYSSVSQQSYEDHMRHHTGEKLLCSFCEKSFFTVLGLNRHVQKFHPSPMKPVIPKIQITPIQSSPEHNKTNNVDESSMKLKLRRRKEPTENFIESSSSANMNDSKEVHLLKEQKPVPCEKPVTALFRTKKIIVARLPTRPVTLRNHAKNESYGLRMNHSRSGKENRKVTEDKSFHETKPKQTVTYDGEKTTGKRVSVKRKPTNSSSHSNSQRKKEPYVCSTCLFTTKSKSMFASHARVHLRPKFSTPEGMFICRTCNDLLPTRCSLIVHQQKHLRPVVLIKKLQF